MNALLRMATGLLRHQPAAPRVEPQLGRYAGPSEGIAIGMDTEAFRKYWNAEMVAPYLLQPKPTGVLVTPESDGDDADELALEFADLRAVRGRTAAILARLTPDVLALPIPTPVRDVLDELLALHQASPTVDHSNPIGTIDSSSIVAPPTSS